MQGYFHVKIFGTARIKNPWCVDKANDEEDVMSQPVGPAMIHPPSLSGHPTHETENVLPLFF